MMMLMAVVVGMRMYSGNSTQRPALKQVTRFAVCTADRGRVGGRQCEGTGRDGWVGEGGGQATLPPPRHQPIARRKSTPLTKTKISVAAVVRR